MEPIENLKRFTKRQDGQDNELKLIRLQSNINRPPGVIPKRIQRFQCIQCDVFIVRIESDDSLICWGCK